MALGDQTQWALLYEGLPYFRLREEVRAAMTPDARALFDELRPVVRQGVFGTAEDAFAAALTITRRFEQAGIAQPPPDFAASAPYGGRPAAGQAAGAGQMGRPVGGGVAAGPDGDAADASGATSPGRAGRGRTVSGRAAGPGRAPGDPRAGPGPTGPTRSGPTAPDHPAGGADGAGGDPGPAGAATPGGHGAGGAPPPPVGAGTGDPAALRDVDAPCSAADLQDALARMEREARRGGAVRSAPPGASGKPGPPVARAARRP